MEPHELMTTEEVAEHFRVNPSTVRRWRLDGVGPRFVKNGSVYSVPEGSSFGVDRRGGHGPTSHNADLDEAREGSNPTTPSPGTGPARPRSPRKPRSPRRTTRTEAPADVATDGEVA